jgi:hypothetical protein
MKSTSQIIRRGMFAIGGVLLWAGAACAMGSSAQTTARLVIGQSDPSALSRTDGTLVGVIQYNGGFQNSLDLKLDTPVTVKYFQVAVPSFCGEVDVLQAKTETEGVYDAATLVATSQNTFSVNGGAGERIGTIELTLNGPSTSNCAIPIYAQDSPSDSAPTSGIGGNFRDANGALGMVINSSMQLTYLDLQVALSTGLAGVGLSVPVQLTAVTETAFTGTSYFAESFLVGTLAVTCQNPVTLTAVLDPTGNQITLSTTYNSTVTVNAFYQCVGTGPVNQSFVYTRE